MLGGGVGILITDGVHYIGTPALTAAFLIFAAGVTATAIGGVGWLATWRD